MLSTLIDVGPSNPANTKRLALAERFRIDTIEEIAKAKGEMDSIRAASQ